MSGTRIVSLILGLMGVFLGIVYWGPTEWVRRPLPPNQTALVQVVESIGPVWPILFVVCGLTLTIAAIIGRYMVAAHILGIFGWMFYGGVLIIGAASAVPPGPIVTGVIAVGVGAVHYGMTRAHQEVGE